MPGQSDSERSQKRQQPKKADSADVYSELVSIRQTLDQLAGYARGVSERDFERHELTVWLLYVLIVGACVLLWKIKRFKVAP